MTNLGYKSNDKVLLNKLYGNDIYKDIEIFCDVKKDHKCALTEYLWGNCTSNNTDNNDKTILDPKPQETLLSWFARNTGETSCRDTTCGTDERFVYGKCIKNDKFDSFDAVCEAKKIVVMGSDEACCETNTIVKVGAGSVSACCFDGNKSRDNVCSPEENQIFTKILETDDATLVCMTTDKDTGGVVVVGAEDAVTVTCDGTLFWLDGNNIPKPVSYTTLNDSPSGYDVDVYYYKKDGEETKKCDYYSSDCGSDDVKGVFVDYKPKTEQ